MGSGLRLRQTDWLRLVPDASPELRAIFGASQGRVLAPVRAEIFGAQRFAQHGQSLGLTHLRVRAKPREAIFFPRLLENLRWLRLAHTYIGAQADVAADLGPAAEWLLDNFHLVEAQLQAVHEGLPRSYFRSLPALCDEPLVGLPRVYGVAWAFVAHTDSAFDESLLVSYLGAYQQACELHLAELWALPTTLRVVLIENLRRLAERLALDQAAREVANLCCDQIQRCSVAGLTEVAEQLGQRGLADAFLAQMAQRLQDHGTGTRMPSPAAIQTWLTQALPDPVAVQARRSAEQTADNLSVSNAVTALRSIGDADWSEVVGHTSPLMHSLLATPLFAAEEIGRAHV